MPDTTEPEHILTEQCWCNPIVEHVAEPRRRYAAATFYDRWGDLRVVEDDGTVLCSTDDGEDEYYLPAPMIPKEGAWARWARLFHARTHEDGFAHNCIAHPLWWLLSPRRPR